MNLIFKTLLRLFPKGSAWKIAADCIRLFIEGITLQFERTKTFISETRQDFVPDTSEKMIEEWYLSLGLAYNPTLPLPELKAKAKAVDTAVGGQDIVYIQNQIDEAGINVTLQELVYPPETRCGNPECRCGVAYCFGNPFDIKTPESAICGIGRTGIARTGNTQSESNLLFYYLVTGEVKNREELSQLIALLEYLTPAHLVPIFDITLLSIFARCGVAVCGLTRTGRDS